MKILDAPSQILNVINNKVRQPKYQVRQTKTPSAQFQSKEYAKKTNIDLRCFVAMQFLSRIYALFWRTFYRPKKIGGVPKMTNMRYGCNSSKQSSLRNCALRTG